MILAWPRYTGHVSHGLRLCVRKVSLLTRKTNCVELFVYINTNCSCISIRTVHVYQHEQFQRGINIRARLVTRTTHTFLKNRFYLYDRCELIWNFDENPEYSVLYSCNLMQNNGIAELNAQYQKFAEQLDWLNGWLIHWMIQR